MCENTPLNSQNLFSETQLKILKWDPDVPENSDTTISYSLSSAQKKNCQVVIKIYNMEGNVVYQTTATQICPGNYSFNWDGMTFSGAIAPTGLYTFDIIVNGKTPDGQVINEDKDQMRSSFLNISNISINPSSFCPCFDEKTTITFNLSESPLNNVVGIRLFNYMADKEKDMKEISKFTLTATGGDNSWQWDGKNKKGIKLNVGKEGGYLDKRPSPPEPYWYRNFCCVIEAMDTHCDYKNHNQKPALPKGVVGQIYYNIVKGAREDICYKYGDYVSTHDPNRRVCTDVVYDALKKAGIDLAKKNPNKTDWYRWAPSMYNYFKERGYLVSSLPYCVGDVIFMHFQTEGPHHVGIITQVNENTGAIKAVLHASSSKNHVWEQTKNPYPNNFKVGRHPKP